MAAIQVLNIVLEINLLQHILCPVPVNLPLVRTNAGFHIQVLKFEINACLAHPVYVLFDLGQSIPVHR